MANSHIESLVIPANAEELRGGVIISSSFTMKIFSPGASLTFPSLSNRIASEISPIIRIDQNIIGNRKVGIITSELISDYTDVVMNRNKKYSEWLTPVY